MKCCGTCKFVEKERYCGANWEYYCNVSKTYPCNRMSAIYSDSLAIKEWHEFHHTQEKNKCVFYEERILE
jgi:hypothetical protein